MSSYFTIKDNPTLVDRIVIDVQPRTTEINGHNGGIVNTWMGGNCHPISEYELRVDLDRPEIFLFSSLFNITLFISDGNLTTANLTTLASEIETVMLFFPGINADVNISPFIWQGDIIYYTINIKTNFPLGVVELRNPSGNFNDPDNIKVTGFDKV